MAKAPGRGRVVAVVVAVVGTVLAPSGAVAAAGSAPPDQGPQTVPFTGLSGPRDVAVDPNGTTYVADTGNDRILKVTRTGAQSTLAFTGLVDPEAVAVAADGTVYVADTGNDRILRLPAGGGAPTTVGFTGLAGPSDVVVDDLGTVYVSDPGNRRVVKRTSAGAQSTVGFTGIGLEGPTGIAVDRDRNVYMVDTTNERVLRLTLAGAQTTLAFGTVLGGRGLAVDGAGTVYLSDDFDQTVEGLRPGGESFLLQFWQLDHPAGLAVDARGSVFVADSGNDRVLSVGSGAGVSGALAFTGLDNPSDVAVDAAGNVFVADTFNDRVVKLPAAGGPQVVVASGLDTPRGIGLDTAGNLFVADTNNDRILRVAAGGGSPTVVGFTDLVLPTGVAVDTAGNVFVVDGGNNRVLKRLTNGSQVELPFVDLFNPWDVAVDRAGNVFASAFDIHELPAGGGPEVVIESGSLSPSGLAVDNQGNLLVASIDKVGELPTTGGGWAPLAFPELSGALGVAVDAAGSVYAADTENNRILKLVRTAPQLRATTSPALPAEISVDGTTRDAWGLNWADVGIGSHQVCFGPVLGYAAPPCQSATLSVGTVTTATGTYSQNGYLRAITSPAVPSTITVDGVARNDWGLWAEVPPGTYQVCFGAVAGYDSPSCRSVAVSAGATATTTGTFATNAAAPGPAGGTGFLRATTSPATASMISVDGQWRNNWGLDWVKLPVGSHEVCFGPAPAATTPPCQTLDVTEGATTAVTGTYVAKGFLRVLTSPALPASIRVDGVVANAFGMWAPRAPGTYQVCFGSVPGYATPGCQSATVSAGATTTITGTYAFG